MLFHFISSRSKYYGVNEGVEHVFVTLLSDMI